MKKNILIPFVFTLSLISQGLIAQDMKIRPDGIIIPKGDHTAVFLEETGQMLYDTVTSSYWYYNGSLWHEVGADNLGNHTATSTLDMAGMPVQNLAAPSNDSDAATKIYVDQHEDPDADPSNELQLMTASTEGDTLYLSDGNWLIVPGISDANYIKDYDGNVYTEVEIDGQVWLAQNLRTTHYNDGTPIPKIELNADWDDWNASWNGSAYTDLYDAYCWYDNDSTQYNKFGALYNWGVVDTMINGGKNACPVGYEVPNSTQISDMITAIGGNLAGLNIKFPPGEFWQASQDFPFGGNGTNSSGFGAVGSGERLNTGTFTNNLITGWFWSATGGTSDNVNALRIRYDDWETHLRTNQSGSEGYPIRCVKSD